MSIQKSVFFVLFYIAVFFYGRRGEAFAQNYPVQITAQLIPPFSGYIPDYSTPGNQNLKLLVLFTDFTKPSYNIKLKIKISGQGINIQSKNYFYEGPFTLQPGIPIEISGIDLSGLLNSNNLDFSGISTSQYEQRKILPEGFYNICFTAYDYNNPTQIQVSNESCAFGWMVLSDPPFLNLPLCGSTVYTNDPQNVLFQWTPMNLSSPNSSASTIYDFELYEVKPGTQSPGNIIQTLPPIYQTTVTLPFINYGITEPQLFVGMQYVWRVRTRDLSNRDLFKNQGYSQICTFNYGTTLSQIDSTTLKLNLKGSALTNRLAKYTWDSLNIFTSYRLEYKKQGGINWFPVNTIHQTCIVNNLEPQSIYEARVKGISSEGEGPWSNVVIITTPAKPIIACGQASPPPLESNFQALKTGKAGQIWTVGQFEMLVSQLESPNNPNGKYSGYGTIDIPFLLNLNLKGKFRNIKVSEEMEVVQGEVEILSDGQNGGNIVDLDSLLKLIDEWFKKFEETGDKTPLLHNLDSLKSLYCYQKPSPEPSLYCSLTDEQKDEKLKSLGGISELKAYAKAMTSGVEGQREIIYTLLNKIKNACMKDIDLSLKDYKPAFTGFDVRDNNLKINGVLYGSISISITWHDNETEVIHPKNKIEMEMDGSSYYLNIHNRIIIKVYPTKPLTEKEQLTILKVYLENLIPTKYLLLFVNGYDLTVPVTDNTVHTIDPMNYWDGIDKLFIDRIGDKNIVYANGNMSISTSNHKNTVTFVSSLISSAKASGKKIIPESFIPLSLIPTYEILPITDNPYYHKANSVTLNTKGNNGGFMERVASGKQAGQDMISKIAKGEIIFNPDSDSIDIVCHSMGFAYAQGMIETFKQSHYKLGRYYIIAPENGCGGSVNLKDFEEVWQYGSNLGMAGEDDIWEQDGVAPQCTVGNLDNNRVGIPKEPGFAKTFDQSHYISNYGWIFKITKDEGKIRKRY